MNEQVHTHICSVRWYSTRVAVVVRWVMLVLTAGSRPGEQMRWMRFKSFISGWKDNSEHWVAGHTAGLSFFLVFLSPSVSIGRDQEPRKLPHPYKCLLHDQQPFLSLHTIIIMDAKN